MRDIVPRLRTWTAGEPTAKEREAAAEIERLHRADERWRQDYREARAEIERLRASLQIVREENDRAKRQFTNVSNKILDDACRALEPKPFPQEPDVEDGM